MMKLTKKQATSVVIFVALMALAYFLRKGYNKRSPYELSPEPIKVDGKDGSIFSLPYDLKCVPGPSATAAYYTKDLTPGGICGDQDFVRSQAEDYKIVDGIGGSLLDQ
jgi:hypothetical protein